MRRREARSGERLDHVWGWRLSSWVVAAMSLAPACWAGEPGVYGANDYMIPSGTARLAYRYSRRVPAEVLGFREKHGREWQIYWDYSLRTPRFVAPNEPFDLVPPEQVPPSAAGEVFEGAARAFVDDNAEFFGVDSTRLGVPYVYPLKQLRVLVFPQVTLSGAYVRGANLRFVVREDGRLAWVRGFIVRGVEEPHGPFLSQADVEAAAEGSGLRVRQVRLQIGFASDDASQSQAIWCVLAVDERGKPLEWIVDARTGGVLSRIDWVKHFDGEGGGTAEVHGKVTGVGPSLADIFLSPQDTASQVESPLRGIVLRDVILTPEGLQLSFPKAITDRAGEFSYVANLTDGLASVDAQLEYGHFLNAAKTKFAQVLRIRPQLTFVPPPRARDEVDLNADLIPEVSLKQFPRESFSLVFNRDTASDSETHLERAYWVQCYQHSHRCLSFAEDTLVSLFNLESPGDPLAPYLPMSTLCIRPFLVTDSERTPDQFECIQEYSPPPGLNCAEVQESPVGTITTAFHFDQQGAEDCAGTDRVEIVPTVLQHEVGHHIFFHVVNARNHGTVQEALEDGVADILTAFANQDVRIGFKTTATGDILPTAEGFSVEEPKSGPFRHRKRVEIAFLFSKLNRLLAIQNNPPDVLTTRLLLFGWLAAQRVGEPEHRFWDGSIDLFEQMLRIDDCLLPDGDCNRTNGTPHFAEILSVFQPVIAADSPFVRGDANTDQRVDISDAMSILNFLFRGAGQFRDCKNSMDADNDADVAITDAIAILQYLFLAGVPLPEPFDEDDDGVLNCGLDPEFPDTQGNLGCMDFTCP